ncbi:hypothetical protein OU798_12965 [Prolixibacteraceae bacterium Z1-6]|uniref:DUF481 domain-containing protein n=1 Tax=Draconibacterium aestuarii TaxID=2998507 RepID=A0A9X3F7N9_9BACT|nr:hypothetical protein [Prolixibacteraceae bacterium Z1-6]
MISKNLFIIFALLFFSTSAAFAGNGNTDTKVKAKGVYSYDKREGKPKIYIEGIRLDMDYMLRNMRFVDFVNDPAVADVHIIINSRISGSGGQVYSLMYNNKTFENLSDFTITATTASSDTYEEQRKKITDALTLGLMPFVNQTEASNNLVIRYRSKDVAAEDFAVDDPWNHWTFRGDVSGSIDIEESREIYNYYFNARADKVTEDWRYRNSARRSVRTKNYTNEGEEYSSNNTSNYFTSSVVKSLSSRWSTGLFASYSNSNYSNIWYSISVKPAIEYNIFPWDISDRKVFTIAYYIGPEWKKYYEETIYDKLQESLWEQTLRLDLQIVQTWGEIEAGLNASNYMHDWSKNRITFDSDLSVRIIRGLSVRFGFRIENVHDQIYLPKGEVSLEDILLNKVQLPSTFEVGADFGVRIQFGSIYNNIVNNRL